MFSDRVNLVEQSEEEQVDIVISKPKVVEEVADELPEPTIERH